MRPTRRCRNTPSGFEASFVSLSGKRVVVLGASYRGRVKEIAFSGVFPTVEALRAAGAEVLVQDPLYDDDELEKLGFAPYHLGEPIDAAVVHTDHAAYRDLETRRPTRPQGAGGRA